MQMEISRYLLKVLVKKKEDKARIRSQSTAGQQRLAIT